MVYWEHFLNVEYNPSSIHSYNLKYYKIYTVSKIYSVAIALNYK
jgi:hypothetical protein